MRRIFVFGLLGPTLGFLMGLISTSALGIPLFEVGVLVVIFAYTYAAGILPAALAGLVDSYLAQRVSRPRRVILTAAAGYFLCVLIRLTLLNRRISIEATLVFALYGMIASALCSVLAVSAVSAEKGTQ